MTQEAEKTTEKAREAYERHKAAAARRQADLSRAGREIGPLPPVVDPERRKRCEADFLTWCKTYFPATFRLPFSKNHGPIARIMQNAAEAGGEFAFCAERGGAKSSFCEAFVIYSIVTNQGRLVLFVGASAAAAMESFQAIKSEFERTSGPFSEDYPEFCYPVAMLDGKPNRARGQLLDGESTGLEWKEGRVIFPTIPGTAAQGQLLAACGYDGRLRGRKYKNKLGEQVRPDIVVFDDIQKDRTAKNAHNVEYQLKVLRSVVKGMRERGRKFTLLVPGTRLHEACFMSQLCDRKKYPSFQGRIFKAIYSMPERLDLWQQYWQIWQDAAAERWAKDPDDETAWEAGKAEATAFYAKNREEMERGADVAWPENHATDELSGLQNLMGIYLDDEQTFWAEYQNEPKSSEGLEDVKLTPDRLLEKALDYLPAGVVPAQCDRLTLAIDVQQTLLYWMVCAWGPGFCGHVVAYGTTPDQTQRIFTARNAPCQLSDAYPGRQLEGQLAAALTDTAARLLGRDWTREDGAKLRISRGLIDCNWAPSTDAITSWIHRQGAGCPLLPCRGKRQTRAGYFMEARKKIASFTQFSYIRKRQPGELVDTVWINSNKVKSFAFQRLVAAMGDPGSVTFCRDGGDHHALLFDHLTSEYFTPASEGDMKYDKWMKIPGRTENHWWDCLCYSIVANAMEGSSLQEIDTAHKKRRRKTLKDFFGERDK